MQPFSRTTVLADALLKFSLPLVNMVHSYLVHSTAIENAQPEVLFRFIRRHNRCDAVACSPDGKVSCVCSVSNSFLRDRSGSARRGTAAILTG